MRPYSAKKFFVHQETEKGNKLVRHGAAKALPSMSRASHSRTSDGSSK
jgi:hypothetical protein